MESDKAKIDQMTRFLLHECSEAEQESAEQAFFEDDDLFYSTLELENDLTDKYAARQMDGDARKRFESSLGHVPSRRHKLSTAIALRNVILHEKYPAKAPEPDSSWQSFWNGLKAFKYAIGLGMASLILIAGVGVVIVSVSFFTGRPDVAANGSNATNVSSTPRPTISPTQGLRDGLVKLRPNNADDPVDIKMPAAGNDLIVTLIVPRGDTGAPFTIRFNNVQISQTAKYNTGLPNETAIDVRISADKLGPATYKLTVSGDAAAQFEYNFRVVP